MQQNIKNILKQTEKNNGIKIIFAIENGSRSWGMESKDSDYDVRFVFFRPVENYISLTPENEVINAAFDKDLKPCPVHGSLIDICGFDIKKYLKLLFSSNPTTIEWLNSPIVYYGNNNLPLREYMKNNFSPQKLFYNYFSLAKHKYKEFIELGKAITYKKYLYVMRGILNAKCVYEFDEIPPLQLQETANKLKNILPDEVSSKLKEIINIKMQGQEKDIVKFIPEFDFFIQTELEKEHKDFIQRNPNVKVFNDFLNQIITN